MRKSHRTSIDSWYQYGAYNNSVITTDSAPAVTTFAAHAVSLETGYRYDIALSKS